MSEKRSRNADDHSKVYRTVGGLDGKSVLYEHPIQTVTPTKVHVGQKPRNKDTLGFYQTRGGGTYVLNRQKLEEEGRCHLEYGPTRVCFYLRRSDVQEEVETPGMSTRGPSEENVSENDSPKDSSEGRPSENRSSEDGPPEPEFKPVPVEDLESEVVGHFESVVSTLETRYGEEFGPRLLLDITLRQSLVDFQAHGKDSALVQQLDSITIARQGRPINPDLRPVPAKRMRSELVKYLSRAVGVLDARYDEGLTKRHFIEVALRQMFVDLRMYGHGSTTVRWLDVLLLE